MKHRATHRYPPLDPTAKRVRSSRPKPVRVVPMNAENLGEALVLLARMCGACERLIAILGSGPARLR